MTRHILMLTIQDALACMDLPDKKKLIVTHVTDKSETTLTENRRDVNMTDFWNELISEFRNHDMRYTTQHISLLRDGEEDWWSRIKMGDQEHEIWIAFVFIKIDSSKTRNQEYQTLKEFFEKENLSAAVYYTFGNADYIVTVQDVERSLLEEKLEKIKGFEGICSYYDAIGKLTSSSDKKWEMIFQESSDPVEKNRKIGLYKDGKCWKIIEKLKEEIVKEEACANKKMVSYYHALLQVMNVMIQYEKSDQKEDFFYMFYPPIQLFFEQLCTALKKADLLEEALKEESNPVKQSRMLIRLNTLKCKIEQSFSGFLDDLEVQFHHIGYSCRDVVADNGRGGLPYDIPIKICKLYIIYLNKLSSLLNDQDNYEYQYCLAPLAYSRPTTDIFDMGLSSERRLIEIQISRSMMYMPYSLMVILAHEVSHYVGTNTRMRTLRNSKYLKVVAMTMTESIFDSVKLEKYTDITHKYIATFKKNVYNYIYNGLEVNYQVLLEKNVKENGSEILEEWSHFRYFREDVTKAFLKLIEDPEGKLYSLIYSIDDETKESIVSIDNPKRVMREIAMFQKAVSRELCLIGLKKNPWDFIELFAKAITEMFADLCAILVLDLDLDDLIEAYVISEGMSLDIDQIPTVLVNRISIVALVMQKNREEKWKNINWNENTTGENTSKSSEFRRKLKKEVCQYIQTFNSISDEKAAYNNHEMETEKDYFYCYDIKEAEQEYLAACYQKVRKQLCGSTKNQILLKEIRNLHRCFGNDIPDQEESFSHFFDICQESERWYKQWYLDKQEESGS